MLLAGITWLTLAMRKSEHSKALKKAALILQLASEVVFSISFVAVGASPLPLNHLNDMSAGSHAGVTVACIVQLARQQSGPSL